MTMAAMTNVDRALLTSEWAGRDDMGYALCPDCNAQASADNGGREIDGGGDHNVGCVHDAALAERGYPDQLSRNRMRALLARACDPTMPPPSQSE
jgi:hypothetical protein